MKITLRTLMLSFSKRSLNTFTSKEGGIICNVTTQAHQSIASQWLQWMKEEHIPDINATGCLTHAVILRLTEVDETKGPTYAVQYQKVGERKYLKNGATR